MPRVRKPDGLTTARRLLDEVGEIFQALGTLDEQARVEAARAALDRGSPMRLLDNLDIRILALRGGST